MSRRGPCSSWACKERGVSGLTIRSSRARFAASALAGYDLTIANAAQRPGLAQALDRSRNRCRSTSVSPSGLFCPRLAQAFDPRHKLRAGKNAGTPFLGSAFRKKRLSGLDSAQGMGSLSKATAGTGLTIRSSRARFAASALAGYDLTIANAAQRPGLAQALDRSRNKCRSTSVNPS